MLDKVRDYQVSADAKKLLYQHTATPGRSSAARRRRRSIASDGRLAVADIEVSIDPRAEWAQMFDEAWRINRDYFYAPNMHGVDWPAMKEKYAALLRRRRRRAATSIA